MGFVLTVVSDDQMLSVAVTVRPSGWRITRPTVKSSKQRPPEGPASVIPYLRSYNRARSAPRPYARLTLELLPFSAVCRAGCEAARVPAPASRRHRRLPTVRARQAADGRPRWAHRSPPRWECRPPRAARPRWLAASF